MKKLIYISHPSLGLESNTKDIEKVIRALYKSDKIFNNFSFVSPVHCYGFMYNDESTEEHYNRGLNYCTDLLEHCDGMIVVGDWMHSKGCTAEINMCNAKGIPYILFDSSDKITSMKEFELVKSLDYLLQYEENRQQ